MKEEVRELRECAEAVMPTFNSLKAGIENAEKVLASGSLKDPTRLADLVRTAKLQLADSDRALKQTARTLKKCHRGSVRSFGRITAGKSANDENMNAQNMKTSDGTSAESSTDTAKRQKTGIQIKTNEMIPAMNSV